VAIVACARSHHHVDSHAFLLFFPLQLMSLLLLLFLLLIFLQLLVSLALHISSVTHFTTFKTSSFISLSYVKEIIVVIKKTLNHHYKSWLKARTNYCIPFICNFFSFSSLLLSCNKIPC
jgi:hypothetical protein